MAKKEQRSQLLAELARESLLDFIPGLTDLIMTKGEVRLYQTDQAVCQQGHPMSFLAIPINGNLRLVYSTSGAGNQTFIGYLQKHRSLGLREILENQEARYSAIAETATSVVMIPKDDFLELIKDKPTLTHYLRLITSSSGIRAFKHFLTERKFEQNELFNVFSAIDATPIQIEAKGVIEFPEPLIYFVKSGQIKIRSREGTRPEFQCEIGEGAWFGGESLIPPHRPSYEAVAHEEVVLHKARLKDLGPILKKARIEDDVYKEPLINKGNQSDIPDVIEGPLSQLPGRQMDRQDLTEAGIMVDLHTFQKCVSDNESIFASIANLASAMNATINLSNIRTELLINPRITLARIAETLESYGLVCRGIQTKFEELHEQSTPSLMKFGNRMMVLLKCDGLNAYLLDPARGPVAVSSRRMKELWDNRILEVLPAVTDPAPKPASRAEKKDTLDAAKKKEEAGIAHLKAAFIKIILEFKMVLVNIFLISLGTFGIGLLFPKISELIMDEVLTLKDMKLLWTYAAGMVLLTFFNMVVSIAQGMTFTQFTSRFDLRLNSLLYRQALALPSSHFGEARVGEIMNRMEEVGKVRSFLSGSTMRTVMDFVEVIVYSSILFSYSATMALVSWAIFPVILGTQLLTRKGLRELYQKAFENGVKTDSMLSEQISAMTTIKATGSESVMRYKWEKRALEGLALGRTLQMRSTIINGLVGLAASGIKTAGTWMSFSMLLEGKLTFGQLMAVSMYMGEVMGPIGSIANLFTQFQEMKISFGRLNDIFLAEPEQSAKNAMVTYSMPLRGKIKFERVSFRYSDTAPWVLRDIDLTIYPNQVVAIVGRSGCGKTTLAKMVAGHMHPSTGRIFFDDFDGQFLSMNCRRQQVGFIMQSNDLFSGTLAENIAYSDDAPNMSLVETAANEANCLGFIQQFPQGMDYKLTEGGMGLSGGQKQRLAIARTLYRKPKILIMDEATSALDAESEKAIMENMKEILKGKTALVIAHRLSTIRSADRIIVIKDGQVVEDGHHTELIKAGGHYSELFENQVATGEL